MAIAVPALLAQSGKTEKPKKRDNSVFVISGRAGRETDLGFVALAGSTARRKRTPSLQPGYRSMRDQLIAEGKLVKNPNPESYQFAIDISFPSPSAAASVVKAAAASGPQDWKLRGSGISYREWRSAQMAS